MKTQKVAEFESQMDRGKVRFQCIAKVEGQKTPTATLRVSRTAEGRGHEVAVATETNMVELKKLRDELTEMIEFMKATEG